MTQEEIRSWLEWFVENFNYSFNSKGDLHESDSGEFYALEMPYGYEIYEALQLAIQDEIGKQGWHFTLRTSPSTKPRVIIRKHLAVKTEFEMIGNKQAETILQAFMIAFQEAWEKSKMTCENCLTQFEESDSVGSSFQLCQGCWESQCSEAWWDELAKFYPSYPEESE